MHPGLFCISKNPKVQALKSFQLALFSSLAKCTSRHQAEQDMYRLALNKFALPGEANFPLNMHFLRPDSPEDTDELRRYMLQFRHELGFRLVDRVFDPKMNNGKSDQPSKWWTSFSKRKFLKCELTN